MSILQSFPGLHASTLAHRLPDLPEPVKPGPAMLTAGDDDGKPAPFELPWNPHVPVDFPKGGKASNQQTYTDADLYGPQDPSNPDGPKGPNPDDIDQDSIGDCYFVATLSAMAQSADGRAQIEQAIDYDPQTGNFTVTLYSKDANGNPVERHITVTQDDIRDNIARGGGSRADNGGGPIWPAVMEAAYAKMHYQDATANGQTPDPRIDGGYGPGSADRLGPDGKPVQAHNPDGSLKFDDKGKPVYEQVHVGGITGGFGGDAYFAVTGKNSTAFQAPSGDGVFGSVITTVDALRIQQALANGQTVTIGTAPEQPGESKDGLAGSHQYSVQAIYQDADGRWMVVLRNPWANNGSDGHGHGTEGIGDGGALITVPLDSIHTTGHEGIVIGDK